MISNQEQNMEYGIWNVEFNTRGSFFSAFKIQNSKFRSRGFTLIETLVAISILLIAVVGPLSIISSSMHNIYYARDQMVAINLAQEGIEVVRQVRDSNKLGGTTWNTSFGVDLFLGGTPYYIVDVVSIGSPLIDPCGIGMCTGTKNVYLDSSTGMYRQTSSNSVPGTYSKTQFVREIKSNNSVGGGCILVTDTECKIISTVTWNTGNTPGAVTVSENLFNWAP